MQAKSKKPKTIQIKYPAPYSQSWTEDKQKAPSNTKRKSYDFGVVKKNPPLVRYNAAPKEKVNKREKNKGPSINVPQIVYPLPSFKTPTPHTERRVTKIRKNATVSRRPSQKVNRAIDPYKSWPPPPPPASRPDPTAPHLKYGVFKPPKDKPIITKTPPTQRLTTPHKAHRMLSVDHANKKKNKVLKVGPLVPGVEVIFVIASFAVVVSLVLQKYIRPRPRRYLPGSGTSSPPAHDISTQPHGYHTKGSIAEVTARL